MRSGFTSKIGGSPVGSPEPCQSRHIHRIEFKRALEERGGLLPRPFLAVEMPEIIRPAHDARRERVRVLVRRFGSVAVPGRPENRAHLAIGVAKLDRRPCARRQLSAAATRVARGSAPAPIPPAATDREGRPVEAPPPVRALARREPTWSTAGAWKRRATPRHQAGQARTPPTESHPWQPRRPARPARTSGQSGAPTAATSWLPAAPFRQRGVSIDRHVGPLLHAPARPGHLHELHVHRLAQTDDDAWIVCRCTW